MIYKKLFQLQEEAQALAKSAENPFFKSQYLPLDKILEHFIPLFNKYKILCINSSCEDTVITTLIDIEEKDESSVRSHFKITNTDPQKRGAEITYGRRYNLGQLLNIMTEIDDDGNKASEISKQVGKVFEPNIDPLPDSQWTGKETKVDGSFGKCTKCGSDNAKSPKTGKIFCSSKCWTK